MKTNKTFALFALLFAISFVSANLVMVGTVYDDDTKTPINGVKITANCEGNDYEDYTLEDGKYALLLNGGVCNEGDLVNVDVIRSSYKSFSGEKKDWSEDVTQELNEFEGNHTAFVVDFFLGTSSSHSTSDFEDVDNGDDDNRGRGSSSSRSSCTVQFWDCPDAWETCFNGKEKRICTSNCATTKIEERTCHTNNQDGSGSVVTLNEENNPENDEIVTSPITGKAVNFLTEKNNLIMIIIVIIIIIILLFVLKKFMK